MLAIYSNECPNELAKCYKIFSALPILHPCLTICIVHTFLSMHLDQMKGEDKIVVDDPIYQPSSPDSKIREIIMLSLSNSDIKFDFTGDSKDAMSINSIELELAQLFQDGVLLASSVTPPLTPSTYDTELNKEEDESTRSGLDN
eukprot:Gb_07158 [translate_table: standard]